MKLDDWHNEARTLELLLKCAKDNREELLMRANQVRYIYEDAITNKSKQERFTKVPITATNGRQILQTAADLVRGEDDNLSTNLEELSKKLFSVEK